MVFFLLSSAAKISPSAELKREKERKKEVGLA